MNFVSNPLYEFTASSPIAAPFSRYCKERIDHPERESDMHEAKLENLTEDDKIRADLATGIMMAVQATGVLEGVGDATVTYATAVLREEVKTFCDPQGAYGEALREVRKGTMTEGDALAMVVATCVEKIAVFKETGLN